jgi:hypothetical protein
VGRSENDSFQDNQFGLSGFWSGCVFACSLCEEKGANDEAAATAGAVSRSLVVSAPLESNNFPSSLGVMAFCCFGAGSTLAYALNRAQIFGSMLLLPAMCRGLVR